MSRRADSGLTLVELLAAMTILALIAGAAYSSLTYAARIYRRDGTQLQLAQRMRHALETLTTDLNQALLDPSRPELELYVEDVSGSGPADALDRLSFVAIIPPAEETLLSEPLGTEPPSVRLLAGTATSRTAEPTGSETPDQLGIQGEVWRVLYCVAPSPETLQDVSTTTVTGTLPQSLLRIRTTTLSLEEAFGEFLQADPAQMVLALWQEGVPIDVLADDVQSFQVAYFDGTEWQSEWNVQEQGLPAAFRVALSVVDPERGEVVYIRSTAARPVVRPPAAGDGGAPSGGGQPGPGQSGASGGGPGPGLPPGPSPGGGGG